MNMLLRHRSLIRQNLVILVGVCLCFYFSYHSIYGNRSFMSLMSLNGSNASLTKEYEGVKAQRVALEKKVTAMRPGTLSRDMLEERARYTLGYRRADEMEIVSPAAGPQ